MWVISLYRLYTLLPFVEPPALLCLWCLEVLVLVVALAVVVLVGEVIGTGQLDPGGRDIHAARDAIVAKVIGRRTGFCTEGLPWEVGRPTAWGIAAVHAVLTGKVGVTSVDGFDGAGRSNDSTTRLYGDKCGERCKGDRVLAERVKCDKWGELWERGEWEVCAEGTYGVLADGTNGAVTVGLQLHDNSCSMIIEKVVTSEIDIFQHHS